MKICGENSGRDVDKFELARLTAVPASEVSAPCIEESPLSIECKVVQEVEVGARVWFMGEVLAIHVRKGHNWKDGVLLKWVGEEGYYHRVGKKSENTNALQPTSTKSSSYDGIIGVLSD